MSAICCRVFVTAGMFADGLVAGRRESVMILLGKGKMEWADIRKEVVQKVAICIQNDEFFIQNDEFCIQNDEFCIQNDEFCIQNLQDFIDDVLGLDANKVKKKSTDLLKK